METALQRARREWDRIPMGATIKQGYAGPVFEAILEHLEATGNAAYQPSSEPSSAPIPGHVEKPSRWQDASHLYAGMQSALIETISDFSKSTGYTEPVWTATWIGSSKLQLTLEWLSLSGPSKAGNPGHVGHSQELQPHE